MGQYESGPFGTEKKAKGGRRTGGAVRRRRRQSLLQCGTRRSLDERVSPLFFSLFFLGASVARAPWCVGVFVRRRGLCFHFGPHFGQQTTCGGAVVWGQPRQIPSPGGVIGF